MKRLLLAFAVILAALFLPAAKACLPTRDSPDRVVYLYPDGQDTDLGIVENGVPVTLGPGESSGIAGPERMLGGESGSITDTGDEARMELYLPEKCNGLMVIGAPGGGYAVKSARSEGSDVARWFKERSVAYCVLIYREPHGHPEVPLRDIQNAIRYCRAHAAEWGVRIIGVTGFSAGGHLAAAASTLYTDDVTRPDFAILNYPWLSMTENDSEVTLACKPNLCGGDPSLEKRYSLYDKVTSDTPPTIIFQGGADDVITTAHVRPYYEALLRCGVPASLHIFSDAAHGWGFSETKNPKKDMLHGDRPRYYALLEAFLEETGRH